MYVWSVALYWWTNGEGDNNFSILSMVQQRNADDNLDGKVNVVF